MDLERGGENREERMRISAPSSRREAISRAVAALYAAFPTCTVRRSKVPIDSSTYNKLFVIHYNLNEFTRRSVFRGRICYAPYPQSSSALYFFPLLLRLLLLRPLLHERGRRLACRASPLVYVCGTRIPFAGPARLRAPFTEIHLLYILACT